VSQRTTDVTTTQEPDVIRVAIVDDHPIARRGVEQVLTAVVGLRVVVSVASAAELAGELTEANADSDYPDVMILDLYHDGDAPCLDAVARLSKGTRVLVMSASGRPVDVLGAIRAGAAGYVTKQSSAEMLVAAVETVAAGGFYLSSQLADILQAELTRPPPAPSPRARAPRAGELSPREEETLSLIARGFTHGQAATRMGVTKATVDTYVERIRSKLQVGNKAELTRAALTYLSEVPEGTEGSDACGDPTR
jgi:two-component system nitrate/nitrite response regulator NarL